MSCFVISQVKAANEPGWLEFLIRTLFNATVISEHDGAVKSGNGGIWKTTGKKFHIPYLSCEMLQETRG